MCWYCLEKIDVTHPLLGVKRLTSWHASPSLTEMLHVRNFARSILDRNCLQIIAWAHGLFVLCVCVCVCVCVCLFFLSCCCVSTEGYAPLVRQENKNSNNNRLTGYNKAIIHNQLIFLRCFYILTQYIILFLGRPMMILTEFLESGSLDNFLKVRFTTSMFIIFMEWR